MAVKRFKNSVFVGATGDVLSFVGVAATATQPSYGISSPLTRSGPGARFINATPGSSDTSEFTVSQHPTTGLLGIVPTGIIG